MICILLPASNPHPVQFNNTIKENGIKFDMYGKQSAISLLWKVHYTFWEKVGLGGKGVLAMHLIHHILVRALSLNSGRLQCHALGGVAQG